VQGRLVGPWVNELRTAWKRAHTSQDGRACIIDLNDVTLIDKSGERLLRAISKKGVQLIANGIYTKHLLERVRTTGKAGLVALIVCSFASLHTNIGVALPGVQSRPADMEMEVKQNPASDAIYTAPGVCQPRTSFKASTEGAAPRE